MPTQDKPTADVLFEQSAEAAFVLDLTGVYQHVTARYALLLSQPASQLLGTRFVESLAPCEAAHHQHQLDRATAGELVRYQASVTLARGPTLVDFQLFPPLGQSHLYGLAQPLAERLHLSAAVLERERQLTIVFNSLADVTFVLDVEAPGRYRFTFVNESFRRTTGLSVSQVVGRYVEEIIPEPSLTLVLAHYQQALSSLERVVWQETTSYPSGQVTGEVSVTPVCDETGHCHQLVGVVHDLTKEKRVEEELRRSNERFRYALKATSDAIYDWNVADDTLYWGEGWAELFGYQASEAPVPFSQWAEAVHPEDEGQARIVQGRRQAVAAGTTPLWQAEYRLRRANGTWATVLDRGYLLRDASGAVVRMLGAIQDITERQQAATEQRLLSQKLSRQNADLQEFTYIISHNLRSPLANALGYADLLPRLDKNAPAFAEALQHLSTTLGQLDEVVADVNGILSLRDEQAGYRPERVALAAVCQLALRGLQAPLKACGGTFVSTLGPELHVVGSRAYFHSIFHNLISNALKYRSDARPLRIEVGALAGAQGELTLTVRDNGLGFDRERAGSDIFQLYRRFHASPAGRGFGLFLVKAHVEAMGGQISVQSQLDVGTEFILYFPPISHENIFN
jgi:PAS domain S-box-containing protein